MWKASHVGFGKFICLFLISWFFSYFDFGITYSNDSVGVSRKAENAYPTGAPDPCSHFLVESDLLICFYYFVCMIFFVVYVSFPCLVFVPGSHSFVCRYNLGSFDYSYILLIYARILVPLTSLKAIVIIIILLFCLFYLVFFHLS